MEASKYCVKFLAFLAFLNVPVNSKSLNSIVQEQKNPIKGPEFYVASLINDWNRKNRDESEIVVFNIGIENETLDKIVLAISKLGSPFLQCNLLQQPRHCERFKIKSSAFIIITSNIFHAVSEILSYLVENNFE